jgi:hypothetical protein
VSVFLPCLRVGAFVFGLVQLLWIAGYIYGGLGGVLGVVVAWLVWPVTLLVSPIYGVIAHGDWRGVLLFTIGPLTGFWAAPGRIEPHRRSRHKRTPGLRCPVVAEGPESA